MGGQATMRGRWYLLVPTTSYCLCYMPFYIPTYVHYGKGFQCFSEL